MATFDAHFVSYGSSADTTAPTVGASTPASGSTIAATDSVAIPISDASGLQDVAVRYVRTGRPDETAFWLTSGGATIGSAFDAASTWSAGVLTLYRDAGWDRSSVSLYVVAVDSDGNETVSAAYTFTVSNPTDAAAPVIAFTPASGSSRTATQSIQIDITDDSGSLSGYQVTVGDELAAYYDGTTRARGSAYDAASTDTAITNGRRVTLYRDDGWKDASTVVRVIASAGADVSTATATYTVSNPTGAAPTLANLSPADGAELGRNAPATFDVIYAGAARKTIVMASFPDGQYHVVYDGDGFAPLYDNDSTITPIGGTYSFSVVPNAYWRGAPTWKVVAINTLGQEGT